MEQNGICIGRRISTDTEDYKKCIDVIKILTDLPYLQAKNILEMTGCILRENIIVSSPSS